MSNPTLNILVVDDVPQNLLAMQALLSGEWQQVLTAGSGAQALELLLAQDVALALVDVQMPGMDGYTLAELMRGTERTRHVPIIFVTAADRDEQRSFRGYEAGAVDFLYKPVDPYVLRSKVEIFLDLHRQRQMLAQRMAEHERLSAVHQRLLAALTRDLREPLAALDLNAQALLRRDDATLVACGQRIQATSAGIRRQVDHLVSLAGKPQDTLRLELQRLDFAALVAQRLASAQTHGLWATPPRLQTLGEDTWLEGDRILLADVVDQMLLPMAMHAQQAALDVTLDAQSRQFLTLSLSLPHALDEGGRAQLMGESRLGELTAAAAPGSTVEPGEAPSVGAALQVAERSARAHGGSLVASSPGRSQTVLELMLPRSQAFANG